MVTKENLKELFTFTKSEQRGIIVLLILICIFTGIKYYFKYFSPEEKYDYSAFKKEIAEFEAQKLPKTEETYVNRMNDAINKRYDSLKLFSFDPNNLTEEMGLKLGLTKKQVSYAVEFIKKGGTFFEKEYFKKICGLKQRQFEILEPFMQIQNSKKSKYHNDYSEQPKPIDDPVFFDFDPNTATREELSQLGFSEKQIAVINNFTSKGGRFKTPEDLKKIYGIPEKQYKQLEKFITIVQLEKKNYQKSRNVVDLNSINTEQMKALGGFWMYNATKISDYRTKLGGFYKKTQLAEIYGVKPEYYAKIQDSVVIDQSKITKIRINFAETDEFSNHPYLNYKEAKAIVEYRDKNGPFTDVKTLKLKKIISPETFEKIAPYLTEK